MTYSVNVHCDGCGKWQNHREKFNEINIDLARYIAFSTGFVPKLNNVEIHFCNECYSRIYDKTSDGKIYYHGEGSTMSQIVGENQKLKKQVKDVEYKLRDYQHKISSIIRKGLEEKKV